MVKPHLKTDMGSTVKLFRLLNDICLIADHPGWLVWDHLNFGKALMTLNV